MRSINNREWAISLWLTLAISISLFNKNISRSAAQLIKAFFALKLLFINLLSLAYASFLAYILWRLKVWEISQLKTVVIWFLTVAAVLVFKTAEAEKPHYFRKLLLHIIEWTILVEFVEGFYTFPLWIEVAIVPVYVFTGLLAYFAKEQKQFHSLLGCFNAAFIGIGVIIFLISLYETIVHWHEALNIEHLSELLLPSIMSVLFTPYLYLLALYNGYEQLFLYMQFRLEKGTAHFTSTKRTLIRVCLLNLSRLNLLRTLIISMDISQSDQLQQLISKVKSAKPSAP